MYDYTLYLDLSRFSGLEGDDAWARDTVYARFEHNCPGWSGVDARITMLNVVDYTHERHMEWAVLLLNNELVNYEVRLRYVAEIKCECGEWTLPVWKCDRCHRHACIAGHHNCK